MDSTWVDTSLSFDLNMNPLLQNEETAKKESGIDFIDMGRKIAAKEEAGVLVEELNRMSAENKKLTEMLTVMCENYNSLQIHMKDLMSKNSSAKEPTTSRKRKAESDDNSNNNGISSIIESSSSDEESFKKPREDLKSKISRVFVRTDPSDKTLAVKDGYQWRKYGQKVTRDNPSPRAYFKCSFAPTCPVKKKVQRSVEDRSVLVATYDGEHNHPHPSQAEAAMGSTHGVALGPSPWSASANSSAPKMTLDMTQPGLRDDAKKSSRDIESPVFKQFLVEQMASSLSKDPSFKAALATAISGRILQHCPAEKW